ncbi:MAG: PAS domain-containing sensor histidine kinase [Methylocystaceae bacterium]|nr:MAG: PAS domain-containing sensor histidine kinase [Methylocystaceae bacterium]
MPGAKGSEAAVAATRKLLRTEQAKLRMLGAVLAAKVARWYQSPLSWRIAIGVVAALAGVGWRLIMPGLGADRPYVTYYLPILVASATGGAVSGLSALALCALAAHLWFAPLASLHDALSLATFLTTNVLIVGGAEIFQRTLTRLDNLETQRALERLAAINTQLVEQFGNVAAAAPGVVFSFRLDAAQRGSCPYVAENVRNVFGLPPEAIRFDTRPVFRRIDPADASRVNANFAASATHMTLLHEEFRYDHPSKGPIWLEIQARPVRQSDGSVVWHGYAQDITERKREEAARLEAERALELRVLELERVNDRLARFAYVASHDLQEPLRKVVAFAQLLDTAVAANNQKDIAYARDVMRASALRARELVDDLLTYSRIVDAPLKLQERDLREEIESALADLSEVIAESKAEIAIDVPPLKFIADPPQFARLMHNLVTNAIKFRRPGATAKITIAARREPDALTLSIADAGVGFEAKYAKAIFEPFKRLHGKAQYPGTGIGLAICKTIADRHGWTLTAESQPSQGATFHIVMPRTAQGRDTPRRTMG